MRTLSDITGIAADLHGVFGRFSQANLDFHNNHLPLRNGKALLFRDDVLHERIMRLHRHLCCQLAGKRQRATVRLRRFFGHKPVVKTSAKAQTVP